MECVYKPFFGDALILVRFASRRNLNHTLFSSINTGITSIVYKLMITVRLQKVVFVLSSDIPST